ncbi:probable protein phosphatase 2C 65 [Ziziphus jujuba]|uniref:Probable protein phosphatase 2C 65 n=1 Tax=Ziziphus jujuba TaxID=326968 RepID=A0A6P4AMP2_ZIZJJ|nr:probable protein phosphatase 2C 65 [Ziziphus jujuba]
MGACCSKDGMHSGRYLEERRVVQKVYDVKEEDDEDQNIQYGDCGARIRLDGFSNFISMYTQQGRKGINQDSMTVWQDFTGEEDMYFCGVFDGHGPYGHMVARHVRDNLPSKISKAVKVAQQSGHNQRNNDGDSSGNEDSEDNHNQKHSINTLSLSSWEACLIKAFKEIDQELSLDTSMDSFCSGSTAVTIVKRGDHLIIANLGDSRAILCSRGEDEELVPVQLTVDLKPDVPSEAERIKSCEGRVFAVDAEPSVYRIWMPDVDCPGLAMARAFGDFCLKDYGLISVPDVSYRKLTDDDEFVILATDGVWDALSNTEVVRIVASARRRSLAAKCLVKGAVRAWRLKYPCSKIDDCAVIVLFLKDQPTYSFYSKSDSTRSNLNDADLVTRIPKTCHRSPRSADSEISLNSSQGNWSNIDEISRVDTVLKMPQGLTLRRSSKDVQEVEAH